MNFKLLLFVLFAVLIFSGCSESDSTKTISDIHDLEVPPGFGFETTKLMHIIAQGNVTRTLVISNQDNETIYSGLLDEVTGFDQTFLMPTSVSQLNFTYNGEVITKNVNASSECFFLTFNANSRDEIIDSDEDGVPDDEDYWPYDPELAYWHVYPPQPPDTTRCCWRPNWSSLAFEDLWPNEGDYDFNDVIINYQISEWLNSCNAVRHIYFEIYYSVDGAGYNDGFYIKVPFDETGVAEINYPDSIPSREGFDYFWDDQNGGDGNLVLRFFEEGNSFMVNPPAFHNTEEGTGFTDPHYFLLNVRLNDSVEYYDRPIYDYPPYNTFLVIDQEIEREVHHANYPPTARINTDYFLTGDDTSDPSIDRYYVTVLNLPWAMHIPDTFDHPLEDISILEAYPQFADWVTSGGTTNTDWYEYPVEENVFDFVDQFETFLYWNY